MREGILLRVLVFCRRRWTRRPRVRAGPRGLSALGWTRSGRRIPETGRGETALARRTVAEGNRLAKERVSLFVLRDAKTAAPFLRDGTEQDGFGVQQMTHRMFDLRRNTKPQVTLSAPLLMAYRDCVTNSLPMPIRPSVRD